MERPLIDLRGRQFAALDRPAHLLDALASRTGLDRRADQALHALGHPLHPVLTDLPIGFWTSSWLLDTFGGERHARTAQLLTGLGLLAALPTALAGLGDLHAMKGGARRVAVVHVAANTAALALFFGSWIVGRRERRRTAVTLSWLGATAATVGGYLGGQLAFNADGLA